jgi:hypothetical protein
MGKSSFMKRKGGNVVTKKMVTERMDDMAALMTAMEATLMEWEVWYRLIPQQKKYLTQEQYEWFVKEGPAFTEFPNKIMSSIRHSMPPIDFAADDKPAEPAKPAILDSTGLPAMKEDTTPRILDSSGHTQNPLG